jgi:NRPS condensation-like uncharacterized protein
MNALDARIAALSPQELEKLASWLLESQDHSGGPERIEPRPPGNTELPLSYLQERLWFLEQMGLVGGAYNIALGLQLEGELDIAALERSFEQLLHRHEILRTRFESRDGVPYQRIDAESEFSLPVVQLGEGRLEELVRKEQRHRFDLAGGALLRVQLVQAENGYVLLLTMHHIISDGWSVGVLVRELSALYAAFSRGEKNPLPALEIQYADYAIWQRQLLQGELLQ